MTKAIILSTIAICLSTNLSAQTASSSNEPIERESNWGLGVDFFLGYGTFTGDLRKKYKSYIPFGVGLDISYKNFVVHGTVQGGYSTTKTDISYDTAIWIKGDLFEVFTPGFSAGYSIGDPGF